MKYASSFRHSLFPIAVFFMFLTARVSYGQGTQPTGKPVASAQASRQAKKAANGSVDLSQVTLTVADLASYESLCKALNSRGVPDKTGSSIVGVSKEDWFNGALSVELTDSNDIFQIRWNNEHKPHFGGSILGVHLNETLEEFRRRFPHLEKVTEIVYKADYNGKWEILVTTYHGKLIDDIAINNNHYSLTVRPR